MVKVKTEYYKINQNEKQNWWFKDRNLRKLRTDKLDKGNPKYSFYYATLTKLLNRQETTWARR